MGKREEVSTCLPDTGVRISQSSVVTSAPLEQASLLDT